MRERSYVFAYAAVFSRTWSFFRGSIVNYYLVLFQQISDEAENGWPSTLDSLVVWTEGINSLEII